jgi:hypothetical protein
MAQNGDHGQVFCIFTDGRALFDQIFLGWTMKKGTFPKSASTDF